MRGFSTRLHDLPMYVANISHFAVYIPYRINVYVLLNEYDMHRIKD